MIIFTNNKKTRDNKKFKIVDWIEVWEEYNKAEFYGVSSHRLRSEPVSKFQMWIFFGNWQMIHELRKKSCEMFCDIEIFL